MIACSSASVSSPYDAAFAGLDAGTGLELTAATGIITAVTGLVRRASSESEAARQRSRDAAMEHFEKASVGPIIVA